MRRLLCAMRNHNNESGLTLIEVLAAMVILTVGILAMAPMLVLSITANQYSEQVTSLAAEAQLKVEEQLSHGSFATMPYVDYSHSDDYQYAIVTEVRDDSVDESIPANIFQVAVTVYWRDAAEVHRTLTFTTYTDKP